MDLSMNVIKMLFTTVILSILLLGCEMDSITYPSTDKIVKDTMFTIYHNPNCVNSIHYCDTSHHYRMMLKLHNDLYNNGIYPWIAINKPIFEYSKDSLMAEDNLVDAIRFAIADQYYIDNNIVDNNDDDIDDNTNVKIINTDSLCFWIKDSILIDRNLIYPHNTIPKIRLDDNTYFTYYL
jgi:hypothetical protein